MIERVIHRRAHAKINVVLRVLGRRPDGYHDIESLVVPISLADELTVRVATELRLTVRGELGQAVPLDEDNLVVRAARALAETCGIEDAADIELTKRIPVAAGLGGGSADAAATLLALNELWGCGLGGEELSAIGAAVGSDVPALLHETAVRVTGRGDTVEPADADPGWWVLVPQPFGVSTADAYRWWDEDGGGPAGPRHDREPFNDLEQPVSRRHPEVAQASELLRAEGARAAVMCGSGPTVAGLAASAEDADRIAGAIPGAIAVNAPP